ncbi:MAG TPA: VacJ family lipoprotein [Burkholderiaceae bacterium]|nr:VacJ family lipoprotein [Burkholderiaceae bacterium]
MPSRLRQISLRAVVVLGLAGLAGCVTVPPNAGQDPRDPWEKFNRNVFAFNDGFDAAILRPAAELWAKLPEGIRDCFSNAFANLRGPSTAINNTLQGKPAEGLSDLGRFAINTTVGIVGCFDVASKLGLEQHREDFGQTLGVWGFGPGPYLVVPIFGASSVRDAIGIFGVEPFLDLNFYIDYPAIEYTVFALRIVNERAELLPADRLVREAALDRYTFIRDGYLQRRRSLIYDGNPPREPDEDEPEGDEPKAPAPTTPDAGGAPTGSTDVKPSGGQD